jgi:hypothetical protein
MWHRRRERPKRTLRNRFRLPAGPPNETALPRLRQPNLRHPLPQMLRGLPTRTQHQTDRATQIKGGQATVCGGVGCLLEGHPRNSNRLPSLR